MHRPVALSLSVKVILVCLVVSLANAVWMMWHAEEEMETAILDQVKHQVVMFIQGIAREIAQQSDPLATAQLNNLLQNRLQESRQDIHDFAVRKLYLYDRQGVVFAHTGPGEEGVKAMQGHYGEVIRKGEPFVAKEIEWLRDPQSGRRTAVVDAIVPVRLAGTVLAGLEAEIDLQETMAIIQQRDGRYEAAIAWMIGLHALLLAVLVSGLMYRLLVRHVHQYDQVTRAIGAGRLTSRITGSLPADELGRLGYAINDMAANIERLVQEQEEAYLQSLRSLMQALEAKDAYTAAHSARVSAFSVQLGRYIGLQEAELELLRKGALMHDLGKIGVKDRILNKPEPLTEEEYAEMQRHPQQTATIMRPLHRFKEFGEIAAWHHERWDGDGYPDRLRAEQIPLLARIVSIADTWDAMTGDRVYRKGMPPQRALAILEQERLSGQWDPHLLAKFITMIREKEALPAS
ncbi:MAG: HD domain-containing protein [Magnetococcales bacterium]|nr:HD domain-containing protein [Magnetococcales bacterium]